MKSYIRSQILVEYDDKGHGPPFVLLHAFPLSRSLWRPQLDALQDIARVIVPDLRGFGGTAPFDGLPSIDRMADDIAELLDALGISARVVLGGLSMGGYVALAFARRHPDRLRGLVLADTRAEADSPETRANRDVLINYARSHTPAEVIETLLPKLLGEQTRARRPEVAVEVRRIAAAQSITGIVNAIQALRDRPDATPFLSQISVPTLILVGSEDVITPLDAAQTMQRAISQAQLQVIATAGHLSSLECPNEVNQALRGFLATLPFAGSAKN